MKVIDNNSNSILYVLSSGGHNRTNTFRKKGAKSEHLGGLCGQGFGDGEDNIDPFVAKTYMSSGSILSFCTTAQLQQIFNLGSINFPLVNNKP